MHIRSWILLAAIVHIQAQSMLRENYILEIQKKDIRHIWAGFNTDSSQTFYALLRNNSIVTVQKISGLPYTCSVKANDQSPDIPACPDSACEIFIQIKEHYENHLRAINKELHRISTQSDTASQSEEEDADIRDFVWIKYQ